MNASEFWSWFVAHEAQLRQLDDSEEETVLDELLDQLESVCDELGFEIGTQPDGVTELIISAEGDREMFDRVRALVAEAPKLEGWRILALKPARGFDFIAEYGDWQLDPDDIWFMPLESDEDPNALGLRLSSPTEESAEDDDFLAACFQLLETGLGEVTLAEDVHHLEIVPLPENAEENGWFALPQLGDYIAWRKEDRGEKAAEETA